MNNDHQKVTIAKSLRGDEQRHVMEAIINIKNQHPSRLAICTSEQQHTYQALVHHVESAVDYLLRQGVMKGDVIALHGKCSFDFICHFLACLSVGLVSVFIDSDLPAARKRLLLEKSNARLTIDFEKEMNPLTETTIKPGVLNEIHEKNNTILQDAISKIAFHDPAYIFFTSGSTGTPKGVLGCHGGLSHFMHWQRDTFQINDNDRVAQITALSFDVILREILLPLISGAALWIPSALEVAYPAKLFEWLVDQKITVIHTIPTMLRTWLLVMTQSTVGKIKKVKKINALRYIFSAGEPLLSSVVESWRKHSGSHTTMINLYGPTETTLAKCYYRLPDALSEGVQPIGLPMRGADVFIMTADQVLCEEKEMGEIVIRTPYRSLGYIDTDQNNVVFQKNKHTDDDSDLLYFTGDLGFWDDMGLLRIVGRKDNQVKLNGVRIELGEIEKSLYAHSDVLHAVALVQEKSDIKTLIAAVSLKKTIQHDELYQHLRTTLPQTHLPSRIIVLDAMPKTASGKVSKTELLKWLDKEKEEARDDSTQALNEVESNIHAIWKKILCVNAIGLDDHIMSLGCSSLQAMSIANVIHDAFHLPLHYKTLIDFPTIRLLAGYIESQCINKKNALMTEKNAILHNSSCADYPLSSSQKRFWIMQKNEFIPSELYNVYAVFQIDSHLDVPKLRQSIDELVRRHRILQYGIHEHHLVPSQRPCDISPSLDIIYLQKDQNAAHYAKKLLCNPIALDSGPLTHFTLLIDDHAMLFVINQHHIITDDIALSQLIVELSDIYNNVERTVNNNTVDFLDYVLHEHDLNDLTAEDQIASLAYWKNHLSDYADIRLPSFAARRAVFDYRGKRLCYAVDTKVTQKITALARQVKHSEFTLFFAAFYILLNQYSGQHDFVIGVPVSSRQTAQLESAIGCFINVLPIKVNCDSAHSLQSLFDNISNHIASGYAHQTCTFEKIIDAIHVQHDLARTPLYQVIFNMQPADVANALDLQGVKITSLEISNDTAKTDITWMIRKSDNQYYVSVDYASSLFSEENIAQLVKSYEILLRNFTDALSHPIGQISLLSEDEKNTYFSERLQAIHVYPERYDYLYSPFVAHAKATPDALAVKAGDGAFSYDEVLKKSEVLAGFLQQYEVKPNQLVAIYLPKSKYQVVAAIGIMMSGAAYLPISSEEAKERLGHILEQAEVNIVITTEALKKTISDFYTAIVIDDEKSWVQESAVSLQVNHHAHDLAYVIFTSGSTGIPKGVMIEHQAALNTIQDMNERYQINARDRIYGLSHLHFDLSVYDIFGTLAAGACLILPKEEDCKEPSAWVEAIISEQITVWNSVPALMQMLVDYVEKSVSKFEMHLSSIRLVWLSGDWIPLNLPKGITRVCGEDTTVISLGGATEASIWSIFYPIKSVSADWKSIPYGYPLWNQEFYILNPYLDSLPIGVVGELYIGGVGLARGYWKDEAKTNAHFLHHPKTGERLYRTGDLGRYLPDGTIEFLGRIDHQVKIRGYRIELGEIEAHIDSYEGVLRSVVVEKAGKLCAYIKSKAPLCIKTLDAFLKNKLPTYMLPTVFHEVESFSLTQNGKINLQALPDILENTSDHANALPQGEREHAIAAVWSSVLGVNTISRFDHFFALGGHSLKALEVILVLKNTLQCEIPLKLLFTHPVLCDFAAQLHGIIENPVADQNSLIIQKFPAQSTYPLSHTQSRIWFIEKMITDKRVYTVSALHKIEGQFDETVFNLALSYMANEHAMLRAVMVDEETGKQTILSEYHPELLSSECLIKATCIHDIAESILQKGLDVLHTPLWKVHRITLPDSASYLLFVFHHLIVDGASLDLFLQSLSEKYNALLNNVEIKKNNDAITYLDYVQSQLHFDNQAITQTHLNYWKNKLIGFENYKLILPTEKARPAQFSFIGSNITFEIASADKVKKIDALVREMHCTRSTLFLGVYHVMLFYVSGQQEILTGQMLVNRNQLAIRDVIGYFANTLVAKSTIQSDQTFFDYIQTVQQDLLNDLQHQAMPFELLINALSPAMDASASPLFQHMYVYQQLEKRNLRLDGVSSERIVYDSASAKFDLTLFVEDAGNVINGKFEYYAEIFSEETIHRFIAAFHVLLDSVISDAHSRLSQLSILDACDEKKMMRWNDTAHDFPKHDDYLYGPFVERAALTPSHCAVLASDGSYQYDALLLAARSLASTLQSLGAKPNQLIAIYLPKSKYQVVAALGVMMSGAAYLPISSEEAPHRLLQILEQGEVNIILTSDALIQNINDTRYNIINLTDESSWFSDSPSQLITHHATTDLAYVIFTSGSTGIPKGVMIEHHAALNTILDVNERFHVIPSDKIYGLSSLHFDLSVYDIFGALAAGATLILPDNGDIKEPSAWFNAIKEHSITIWNTVPALMQMLCDYTLASDASFSLNSIRLVLMSGDWIPLSLPENIRKITRADATIISLGGATEASIWSILYPIKNSVSTWKSIPYGYPMWNQQFYILNKQLDFVLPGVVGELCIAGKGLARGYWNSAEKTAASFVIHPKTGERIYRTGDLGRYDRDGIIEFLGRVDQQVKINGYRVELGEIEAQIERCTGVFQSVVVERAGKLFAYVIADETFNEKKSIHALKNALPQYMVPVAIMPLSHFPLTTNGKVDRKALPDIQLASHQNCFDAPHSELEKRIAVIWSRELAMSPIGRHDNFFALGGNSLKAVSVMNALKKDFSGEIPLRLLFSAETLCEFANALDAIEQKNQQAEENIIIGEL